MKSQEIHIVQSNLPSFVNVPAVPTALYNGIDGQTFAEAVDEIYSSIITWRKNLFLTPSGEAGKAFIKLLTTWLKNFNSDSTFKGIALKVFMVLPSLMLQKPSSTSKTKDHVKALIIRMQDYPAAQSRSCNPLDEKYD